VSAFNQEPHVLIHPGRTPRFPHRQDVDRANALRMNLLTSRIETFVARDGGCEDKDKCEKLFANFMAVQSLSLRVGAQVMLIKNTEDRNLVNGSIGCVEAFMDAETYRNEVEIEGGGLSGEVSKKPLTVTDVLYPLVQFSLPNGEYRTMLVTPETFKVESPLGEVLASRTQVCVCRLLQARFCA
jgi:ATP-dependent DNA helicase PIF1